MTAEELAACEAVLRQFETQAITPLTAYEFLTALKAVLSGDSDKAVAFMIGSTLRIGRRSQ